MTYRSALGFLDSLVDYEKQAAPRSEFKLDNIRRLLNLSGNPQKRLKRTVLVAGTKGKGSVCCMLDAALRSCGAATGLFVSPHVASVRERIQVNGHWMSKRGFARLVEYYRPFVRKQTVSYFELTAAMAFEAFARAQVEYAVVEVGLGGRLDATNLCEPEMSVVTRIGLDHIKVLGRTLRRIAAEKAGIMRRGRPVVVGAQARAAERELIRRARQVGAALVPASRDVRVWDVSGSQSGIAFSVLGELGAARIRLPLLGQHQVENCSTAMAVLGLLARADPRIRMLRVRRGLRRVVIPARCQLVSRRPTVLVDSCHNPDSGRALADAVRQHLGPRVVLVYGSLRGKLIFKTVRELAPVVERAVLVEPDSPRAACCAYLKPVFGRLGLPYVSVGSLTRGLALAREISGGSKPVVVAGSFYLAGEALRHLGAPVAG